MSLATAAELWRMSATGLARAIRTRPASSVEVVEAHLPGDRGWAGPEGAGGGGDRREPRDRPGRRGTTGRPGAGVALLARSQHQVAEAAGALPRDGVWELGGGGGHVAEELRGTHPEG